MFAEAEVGRREEEEGKSFAIRTVGCRRMTDLTSVAAASQVVAAAAAEIHTESSRHMTGSGQIDANPAADVAADRIHIAAEGLIHTVGQNAAVQNVVVQTVDGLNSVGSSVAG